MSTHKESAQVTMDKPSLTVDGVPMLMLAIMVKRAGGEAQITQQDIDSVAFGRLIEERYQDGSIVFKYEERTKQ